MIYCALTDRHTPRAKGSQPRRQRTVSRHKAAGAATVYRLCGGKTARTNTAACSSSARISWRDAWPAASRIALVHAREHRVHALEGLTR